MSKICPNCLHPVRTGVNYCGYCGASLVPTPVDPMPTSPHASKDAARLRKQPNRKAQRTAKIKPSGRSWIKAPITLLVLVILAALAVRFWPQILILLGQAVVLLKLT